MTLTDEELAGLDEIITHIEKLGDITGGWTSKFQARRTGLSLYLTFEQKVDVMDSIAFANMLQQAPGLLLAAAKKLKGDCPDYGCTPTDPNPLSVHPGLECPNQ